MTYVSFIFSLKKDKIKYKLFHQHIFKCRTYQGI